MSAPRPSIRVETHRARRLGWWVSTRVVGLGVRGGEKGMGRGRGRGRGMRDLGGERA